MSVIAFGSVRGAPGVTTATVAVAQVWPRTDPLLVVEADPHGGELIGAWNLPTVPTLLTLAAAAAGHDLSSSMLEDHSHQVGELTVLAAPQQPTPARAAVRALAGSLPRMLEQWTGHVLVDLGRLDPDTEPFWSAAAIRVLVARATAPTEIVRLRERVTNPSTPPVLVLIRDVVSARQERRPNAAALAGIPIVALLADDLKTARALCGHGSPPSEWSERSPLIRSARDMANVLARAIAAHGGGRSAERSVLHKI